MNQILQPGREVEAFIEGYEGEHVGARIGRGRMVEGTLTRLSGVGVARGTCGIVMAGSDKIVLTFNVDDITSVSIGESALAGIQVKRK